MITAGAGWEVALKTIGAVLVVGVFLYFFIQHKKKQN